MSKDIGDAARQVITDLMEYQRSFRKFQKMVGLGPIPNKHEPVSGCVDKLGRLTRHVKHNDRNDPKPDFPHAAVRAYAGLLAYLDIIMEELDISDADFVEGFSQELMKSAEQHGGNDE